MRTPPLYLASASPRRRELLTRLGVAYTVGVAPLDEEVEAARYTGPSDGLAEYLARAKARSVVEAAFTATPHGRAAERDAVTPTDPTAPGAAGAPVPDELDRPSLILAADTTVLLAGRVLGKPADAAEAVTMLRALRNRGHVVITGVALGIPSAAPRRGGEPLGAIRSAAVATRVRMRDYTDDEIATYVASGDPLDKAGAYGVQHPSFQPVAAIAGCYTSVVGLPLCATAALLAGAGLAVTTMPESPDLGNSEPSGPCPFAGRCRAPLPREAADWPGGGKSR